MNDNSAKKIGGRQGLISTGLGIIIAQLIMTSLIALDEGFIRAFFWFMEVTYKLNLIVGVVIMLLSGYIFGQVGAKAILVKKKNFLLVGTLTGIAVLFTTAFFSSWTGFLQEGFKNIGTNDNPFEDYIFKPMFWITVFGLIPAILVGIWFGIQIKRKGSIKRN